MIHVPQSSQRSARTLQAEGIAKCPLSPEQANLVDLNLSREAPTLVKGGPGNGKGVVALYRCVALLKALRTNWNSSPSILFTTYTNALIAFSRGLWKSLMPEGH